MRGEEIQMTELDELLQGGDQRQKPLPEQVLKDLRYIRDKIDKEHAPAPSRARLLDYIERTHKVKVGRQRLYSAAKQAGIEPWWSAGR